MSNWDLMMPGMGLTAIGLAGVVVSYAGIAHTFIDGMHALTGLTMFIGMIFLAAGILDGGVSTSNRAKATTLVVLGISLSFGLAAFNFTTITTLPTFAGVMLIISVPAVVIAYVAMKMPQYTKPIAIIFIVAVGAAVMAYVLFGLFGPSQYLVPPPVPEEVVEEAPESHAPIFAISILSGSSIQGNPDYDPDEAHVPIGNIVEWTNDDDVAHTVTSKADAGALFDSGLMDAGQKYQLQTDGMDVGTYEYYCIVHPWMVATLVLEQAAEAPQFEISILPNSDIQGNPDYDPDVATVSIGSAIVWTNDDDVMHTVTSGAQQGGPDGLFDSGIMNAGDTFTLQTTGMSPGTYNYLCIVHPWMVASIELVDGIVEESDQRLADGATAADPNTIPVEQMPAEPEVVEEPAQEVAVGEVTTEPVVDEQNAAEETPAQTAESFVISVPAGSAMPGCEVDDACYIPSSITVPVGAEVTWSNDDTAAHTVTSGDLKSGPIGKFDSGLFMAGKTFSFTFESPGTYPYYCQVHPWMIGKVIVK